MNDYSSRAARRDRSEEQEEAAYKAALAAEIARSAAEANAGSDFMADIRVGWSCREGLKPDFPNQDDFCVLCVDNHSSVYGVFDGHGPYGHDMSSFVQEALPKAFVQHPRFDDVPDEALEDAFKQTQKACVEEQQEGRLDCSLSGTTATVAMLRNQTLHVAHVGDSRAVLARVRKDTLELEVQDLTWDHKPAVEEERRRIEKAEGEVRHMAGDVPHRVFLKGQMYPGLAMTRAIGDTLVNPVAGVISSPTVRTYEVEKDWRFLLICSDGVWEFLSSQEAVDIVGDYNSSTAKGAAERLTKEAWSRWLQEEGDFADDITVVCAWFDHH